MSASFAAQRWSHLYPFKQDLNHYLSIQTSSINLLNLPWERKEFLKWVNREEKIREKESEFYKNIFNLFQVDLDNWNEIDFILIKNLGMSFNDIDKQPYYRIQYLIENYKDYLEKEKERQEKEEKGNQEKFSLSNTQKDAQNMMKQQQAKMPKMPNIKMPKL